MPPGEIISKDKCPRCLASGREEFLRNRDGRFETYCPKGHAWNDTEELHDELRAAKRQMPQHYPKAEAPAPGPAIETIVIDREAKILLESELGTQLTSGNDLKGAIWALKQELKDTQAELTRSRATNIAVAKAKGGMAGPAVEGAVPIVIPEWAVHNVAELAEHEEKSVPEWLQEQVDGYLEAYLAITPRARQG